PYPGKALQSGTMKPITAYLGDTSVLFHQLPHAWIQALGPTALVVLAVGGLASVAILIRPPGGEARWRAAALVALGSMVTYAMTPGTAAGPPGGPLRGLFMDTRFIAPGLCLALILAPMLVSHLSVKARDLAALPMAFFVVSAASKNNSWGLVHPRIPMLTAASVILIGTGITTWYPGSSRRARSAAIVMALLILVPAGSIYEHSFAAGAVNGHGPALATTGPARVGVTGISGTFAQYLQVGESLQNEVSYVGIKGPHGALRPPRTCQEMKAEINRAGYTWIVASPNRSIWKQRTFPDLEQRWLAADPNAKFVRNIRGLEHNLPASGSGPPDPFLVYRLVGPLSGASCPK
ncbi:MAG: hypothetical protein WCI34_04810, partial [Actinomycetes bacterium]